MKEIKLTQGYTTQVDDEDYEWLNQWKWWTMILKDIRYAVRSEQINGKGKHIYMHREILKTPLGIKTDHRDGNGLNNQRDNLRTCTHAENMRNRRSFGTSKYLGVCVKKLKSGDIVYLAQITVNRKTIYLGRFKDEISAALVYNEAAIKYNGKFARLNIIP